MIKECKMINHPVMGWSNVYTEEITQQKLDELNNDSIKRTLFVSVNVLGRLFDKTIFSGIMTLDKYAPDVHIPRYEYGRYKNITIDIDEILKGEEWMIL